MKIELGDPIHTAEVIKTRDEVYFAAQSRARALNHVDYSSYNDRQYREAMERDQAERRALEAAQLKTPFGLVMDALMDIRSRAYDAKYGPGSYPPKYDKDDQYPETLVFPLWGDENPIGSLRVTFSPKGVARKLRLEDHGVNIPNLLSYLLPSQLRSGWYSTSLQTSGKVRDSLLTSGWDEGIKASDKFGVAKMRDLKLQAIAKNMPYAEIGSMAHEPLEELKGKGVGTEMAKQLFERVMRDGGINGEQFLIAEATPASATPLLKAAAATGIPSLVLTGAGTVRSTSNGTVVPRIIIVFSHDRNFIENMAYNGPDSVTPEVYLKNLDLVDDYLREEIKGKQQGIPDKLFSILKIDRDNPYPWLPWIKKPEDHVLAATRTRATFRTG